jgi:L-histidine Nalpha-methyltransferase
MTEDRGSVFSEAGVGQPSFRRVAAGDRAPQGRALALVSLEEQNVDIEALSIRVHFSAGETIHTESSVKYDEARVHRLLARSGFEAQTTYADAERLFAVHLARVSQRGAAERANGVAA